MRKKVKFNIIAVFCFSLLIPTILSVSSQTQQNALLAIQQADERLFETIVLLEEASKTNINIRDLVINTDIARQLIVDAKKEFEEANYTAAYGKANDANEQLVAVINELELRENKKEQNNILLFSLLGVFSAILAILFIIIFIKKIYPWYLEKRIEEYSKLEIQYKKEEEVAKNE